MSDNKNKPNRGQDEKTHEFTNPQTGETRTGTMREYRDTLRNEGWQKVGEEEAEEGDEGEE